VQTRIDEAGNEFVVVPLDAPKPVKGKAASSQPKPNDNQIADQAIAEWGKPLAFQAGHLWSYSLSEGWTVVTDLFTVMTNKLRGMNTENSVMKIVATKMRLPDLELCSTHSTYWERLEDAWRPFPVSENQVVFSNGILDLLTMEFEPTEHRIIFGPRISIPFNPDRTFSESCSEFESLVEAALPEKEERDYLQAVCGLILQPHSVLRGQIVFHGVPHSGKTTLATAIATAPAGVRGQSAVSEERLIADKWASTMLVNKFANVSNDSEFTPKWEAFMKQYTSGSFTCEAKFARPSTVPTTAKLISTCNEMQNMKDVSGAAEMRYRIFRFNNPIAESNNPNQAKMMTAGYWATPEKRAGIVAWMLEGLARVIESGLIEPVSMKLAKRGVMCESNPVLEFIVENIEKAEGSFLESSNLLEAMGIDHRNPLNRQIPGSMKKVWGEAKCRMKVPDKPNPVWGYRNVRLN